MGYGQKKIKNKWNHLQKHEVRLKLRGVPKKYSKKGLRGAGAADTKHGIWNNN